MRWNEFILLVGVSIEHDRVQLVHINESKNRSAVTMGSWVKRHCRIANDHWSCSVGKRRLTQPRALADGFLDLRTSFKPTVAPLRTRSPATRYLALSRR